VKLESPATARNREPIADVLARFLPSQGLVLEIASGSGEHAVHFAKRFSSLHWQPTDQDPRALASIAAYQAEAGLPNLLPPLELDVTRTPWPLAHDADAIVCINMIHISPIEAMEQLFTGASRVLPADGLLFLYGPYRFHGTFTAPSNEAFDQSLRSRDPRWGVRDIREINAAATRTGFGLVDTIAMPANNHSLIFRRRPLMPGQSSVI
jgi:SAM-dependent methyltransferase